MKYIQKANEIFVKKTQTSLLKMFFWIKNICERGVFSFPGTLNEKNNQKMMKKLYGYVKMNKMVEIAHYMNNSANYRGNADAIIHS